MMNKFFLLLVFSFLLFSSFVSADMLSIDSGSGSNIVIDSVSDGEIGFFGSLNLLLSGTDSSVSSTEYYDVIVNVVDRFYSPGQTVVAEITIFNKGDLPDRDSVLRYYFSDPNSTLSLSSVEQFEEVSPGEHLFVREITLPPDAPLGDWSFVVEYDTAFQPLILVHDSFLVVRYPFWKKYFFVFLIILFGCCYWWFVVLRRRREEEEEANR
jgi:hypothetical protein